MVEKLKKEPIAEKSDGLSIYNSLIIQPVLYFYLYKLSDLARGIEEGKGDSIERLYSRRI